MRTPFVVGAVVLLWLPAIGHFVVAGIAVAEDHNPLISVRQPMLADTAWGAFTSCAAIGMLFSAAGIAVIRSHRRRTA